MEEEKTKNKAERKEEKTSRRSIVGISLRILLVLIVGAIIGTVVYFSAAGWVPYLEQRFFGQVNHYQELIREMAATQGALETQIAFLQEEIQENQVTYNQDLEAAITSAERNLADLRADLEEAISFSYTQIPAQLATLSARQEADSSHISALATAQMKYRGSEYEGEIARIIAHLSRANQFLLHANYGLAKDQLIAAQQVLLEMEIGLENGQLLQAQELLSLIEGSIADLPEQPALAAGRLELAWELAVSGFLPFHEQNQSGTPSPTPWETITPTTTPN